LGTKSDQHGMHAKHRLPIRQEIV